MLHSVFVFVFTPAIHSFGLNGCDVSKGKGFSPRTNTRGSPRLYHM